MINIYFFSEREIEDVILVSRCGLAVGVRYKIPDPPTSPSLISLNGFCGRKAKCFHLMRPAVPLSVGRKAIYTLAVLVNAVVMLLNVT